MQTDNSKAVRYQFIDIAKGLGIVFIVMGHIVPNERVIQLLYSFHVPLFFLISGFTYRLKYNKLHLFICKFLRLIIPYITFSVISIIIYYFMSQLIYLEGDSRMIPNILGMLFANSNSGYMTWNRPLWFLPCLFVSSILLDILETLIHKANVSIRNYCRVLLVFMLWVTGIILNCHIDALYLPLHFESAVFLTGFSELGVIVSSFSTGHSEKTHCENWKRVLLCAILVIVGFLVAKVNGFTDIRSHSFGNHPCFLIVSSVAFSIAVMLLSTLLSNCYFLANWGASSMSILLMHKFPILFFQEIMPYVKDVLTLMNTFVSTTLGVFLSLIVILMCLFADSIISNFCPIIIGKSKLRVSVQYNNASESDRY